MARNGAKALLRRDPDEAPGVGAGTGRQLDAETAPGAPEDGGDILACAACGQTVTRTGARCDAAGGHAHVRENPHGVRFHFGCFAAAPGCRPQGSPTQAHSWFPGYAWQIGVCAGCGVHLGWRFTGAGGPAFFGLVFDRLVERPAERGPDA